MRESVWSETCWAYFLSGGLFPVVPCMVPWYIKKREMGWIRPHVLASSYILLNAGSPNNLKSQSQPNPDQSIPIQCRPSSQGRAGLKAE